MRSTKSLVDGQVECDEQVADEKNTYRDMVASSR